jgi:hypothetical protein
LSIAMTKPWQPLTPQGMARVAGHMGVYQLADAHGAVQYIGQADGRSLHGLRGELLRWLDAPGAITQYRIEITTAYTTRWLELLMAHVARHGRLPPSNPDTDARRLGRLSPS